MPDNQVLFRIGGESWTLAGVCLTLAGLLFVSSLALLLLLLARYGHKRRLAGREASQVAFNAGDRHEVGSIHGPAVGAEAQLSVSIGDLRRAHRSGDRLMFWGMPAMLMGWSAAFGLGSFALALWMGEWMPLLGLIVLVPMFLIAGFMPWAALHTKLE
jgi:hypothetical protein